MFYAMDGKRISLLICLLIFATTIPVQVRAAVEEVPVVYGAPFSVNTRYSYRVSGASTVPGAISEWWGKYQSYWGVSSCGYALTLYPSSSERRAYQRLINGCGGGDSVTGTAQCPSGYQLVDNRCLIAPNEPNIEKDRGSSCNNKGNPINAATGNKYQRSVDFEGIGPNPLAIERHYNSTDQSIGAFGTGWGWSYSASLSSTGAGSLDSIQLQLGNGRLLYFIKKDEGWVSDSDIRLGLTELPNGEGYLLTHPDGSSHTFDVEGLLLAQTDRIGHETTFGYDASGRLTGVTSDFSQEMTIAYTSKNLISRIEHSSGQTWNYKYDDNYRLIQVIYPDDTAKTYFYEDAAHPYALTGIEDERGARYATFAYDSEGRAIESVHADGVDGYRFSYDSLLTTTVTNPLGKKTTYHYEVIEGVKRPVRVEGHESSSCAGANQSYEYDSAGRVVKKVGWNNEVIVFDRNARGQVVSQTQAQGTTEQRQIDTQWHPEFDLPVRSSEQKRVRDYEYDGRGRLIRRTESDTDTSRHRTWEYNYYADDVNRPGRLKSLDGPRAGAMDITEYRYDARGYLSEWVNALGHVTQVSERDSAGRVLGIISPNGTTTNLTYDARGNITTRTVQSEQGEVTTAFEYDPVGQLTEIAFPDGSSLDYTYDAARRLTSVEDNLGNRIEFTHNAMGNVTAETAKDASGNVTRKHQQVFNELGRLMRSIRADSVATRYGYDKNSNLTSIVDGNSLETRRAYDALDRLSQITDPLGGQVTFTYDAADNLTSVTDQRGLKTEYEYNFAGEMIARHSPDTGTTTFERDNAGNVTRKTDARGVITEYSYDALNRLTEVRYPDAPEENIVYSYDDTANDNKGIGRLTGISDQSGTLAYRYDALGNVTEVNRSIEGQSYTTAYRYDLMNRLTGITYPSGRIVTYTRNAVGEVSAITTQEDAAAPEQVVVQDVTYLPFGPMKQLTYGNGLIRDVSYNQDYQITGINSGALQRTYDYDLVDNIQSITDLLDPAQTQTFQYDALSRLTQATGAYGQVNYRYDGVGNRLSRERAQDNRVVAEEYTYASTSNRLESVVTDDDGVLSERQLSYSPVGNIDQDQQPDHQRSLIYNQQNRLEEIQQNGEVLALYIHNALGQRVIKVATDPEQNLHFHYDQAGQLIAETGPDGSTLRELIYLNGVPVAVLTETVEASSLEPVGLEAEDATWSNAEVDSVHEGFSGSGFVDYLGEGYIEWTVELPKTGTYALDVRYALASGSRPLEVQIDGATAQTLAFGATGSWTTWGNQTGELMLAAGTHTLRLRTTGRSGANVDWLNLEWLGAVQNTVELQAEHGARSNAKVDDLHEGYSGSGFVDYLGEGYIEWTVNLPEANTYALNVRYALGNGSRPLELQVDGTTVQTLAFDATGGWTTWGDQTGELSLTEGAHVIRLQTTGSSGANIDSLRLSANGES